jgi:CRP-like cAMP-binding protein
MSSAAYTPAPDTDLTTLKVFDRCPPERLAAIDPVPEELEVQAGESIVREGHVDHEWYVVLAGEASVSTMGHVLGVLGPGEHFGEIAILSRQARRFTVRALTPMRVLVLAEGAFLSLLDECAPFGRTLLVRMSRRMSSMGDAEPAVPPQGPPR